MASFLIVEDDPVACGMMADAARVMGHSACGVMDAASAMEAIGGGGIDCAIIDWWLQPQPPGCGYRLALMARDGGIETALVTGYPTQDFQTQGHDLEARGGLLRVKPYHVLDLIAELARMSGKSPEKAREGRWSSSTASSARSARPPARS